MSLSAKVHYSFDMAQQVLYSGRVWQVESLAILVNCLRFSKLKSSKLVVIINSPLADLFIRQTFFRQTLEKNKFAKHSARQTFLLYSNLEI